MEEDNLTLNTGKQGGESSITCLRLMMTEEQELSSVNQVTHQADSSKSGRALGKRDFETGRFGPRSLREAIRSLPNLGGFEG